MLRINITYYMVTENCASVFHVTGIHLVEGCHSIRDFL